MSRTDTIKGFAEAIADYVLDAIEDAAIDARDEIETNEELDGEGQEMFFGPQETLELISTDILEGVVEILHRRQKEADDIAISSATPELLSWNALREKYPRQKYLL